jgi:hypothetical protein
MRFWGRQGVSDAVELVSNPDYSGLFAPVTTGNLVLWDDSFNALTQAITGGLLTDIPNQDSTGMDVRSVSYPGSRFNFNTFNATGSLGLTYGNVFKDYTITADWVGSAGTSTFTATLEGSMTGAFAGEQRILATMTEGTSNLKLSVTSEPWPYTRVNLSALSLDTATGLTLNGVAQ